MTFEPVFPWPWYWLLTAVCAGLAAWSVLRSLAVRDRRLRSLLLTLRLLVLAGVLFVLAHPVTRRPARHPGADEDVRAILLLDTSRSMSLGRPRSRYEQATETVRNLLGPGNRRDHTAVYCFDDGRAPRHSEPAALPPEPQGASTQMGEALAGILESRAPGSLDTVVVLSDGTIHDRDRLGEAVRMARRTGVRVSSLCFGESGRVPNAAVSACFVQRQVLPRSRVPVRVRIRAYDLLDVPLTVSLTGPDGTPVDTATVTPESEQPEARLELIAGESSAAYTVHIAPVPGELTVADNRAEFRLRVIDPPIRVLYMEGSNHRDKRWEEKWAYEFIPEALREEDRIEDTVLTVDEQVAAGGRLFRIDDPDAGFPETRKDLLSYDVVICSDINRTIFSDDELAWTVDLVARQGGGFCMIGGYTAFGAGGWDRTVWEQLIPMDMATGEEGYVWETFTPEIPEAAVSHPIWQLDADPDRNRRILEAHPPFLGTNLVRRAKPAATVLAVWEEREMPVIAVQPYGRGRTMAFTSDAAGGWGERYQTEWGEGERDNRYYRAFWVRAVRWLAENSLAGHRTPLVGNTDRVACRPGETVAVSARNVQVETPELLRDRTVTVRAENSDQPPRSLALNERTGVFEGVFPIPAAWSDDEAVLIFEERGPEGTVAQSDRVLLHVRVRDREFLTVEPDPDLLSDLAAVTGGVDAESPGEVASLLDAACSREAVERSAYTVPLWDRPWLLALLVALLCVDWLIRKRVRMASA